LDSDTGKVLQSLPISTGVDDMVFDPASQRVYVAAGEGFVNVFKEIDADHYQAISERFPLAHWPTGQDRFIGAGTERVFSGRAAAWNNACGGSGLRCEMSRIQECHSPERRCENRHREIGVRGVPGFKRLRIADQAIYQRQADNTDMKRGV
jgi:hypothetical protein